MAVVEIGGQLRGLDEDGVVFRDYAQAPADLPLVETSADTGAEALREGALVVASLPERPRRARSTTSTSKTVDEITLELRDGREVEWGSAEQSDQKAAVLDRPAHRRQGAALRRLRARAAHDHEGR